MSRFAAASRACAAAASASDWQNPLLLHTPANIVLSRLAIGDLATQNFHGAGRIDPDADATAVAGHDDNADTAVDND
jgi:hypothetical protein